MRRRLILAGAVTLVVAGIGAALFSEHIDAGDTSPQWRDNGDGTLHMHVAGRPTGWSVDALQHEVIDPTGMRHGCHPAWCQDLAQAMAEAAASAPGR